MFQAADAGPLFAVVERERAHLRQWLPWVDRTRTVDDIRLFIARVTEQYNDQRGPNCGIWIEGELAGSVGCHPIDWANYQCSVGYWLAAGREGRGVVTRCCEALIDYLLDELRLHRVVIQCGTANTRSCAIPARLGFRHEGVLREAEWVNDRWVDLMVWSLLEGEWRGRRGAKA
jgi:ribosomal-protein-serine acetyltransferase